MFRPEEMFSLVRSLEFETVHVVAVPDYCVANDSSGSTRMKIRGSDILPNII